METHRRHRSWGREGEARPLEGTGPDFGALALLGGPNGKRANTAEAVKNNVPSKETMVHEAFVLLG